MELSNYTDTLETIKVVCNLIVVVVALLGGKYLVPLIKDKRWQSIAERVVLAAAQIYKAVEGDKETANSLKLTFAVDSFIQQTGALADAASVFIEGAFKKLKSEGKVE